MFSLFQRNLLTLLHLTFYTDFIGYLSIIVFNTRYSSSPTKHSHGLAPLYISDLIHTYSPVHTLRSSDTGLLLIPRHKLASFGGRAFVSLLCPHTLEILFPNTFAISLHYKISKPTLKHIFSFLVSLISDCMIWFMPWISCLSVFCFSVCRHVYLFWYCKETLSLHKGAI